MKIFRDIFNKKQRKKAERKQLTLFELLRCKEGKKIYDDFWEKELWKKEL